MRFNFYIFLKKYSQNPQSEYLSKHGLKYKIIVMNESYEQQMKNFNEFADLL